MWILEQEGKDSGLFIFAHNAHIQNAPFPRPEGTGIPMGVHLKRGLGNDVLTIGSAHGSMVDSTAFGYYWATKSDIAEVLARTGEALFALDIRSNPWPADEDEWWMGDHTFDFGFLSTELPVAGIFDVWLYVDELTPHQKW